MSFQEEDIKKGLNSNRYLYALDTGLGKSYILAGIYAHRKSYGEINKAIILTSSIGIINLAGELKKFIRHYDESRTLVISSISNLKNRQVFDNDDYDIIICGYDTFRCINDQYDKAVDAKKKDRNKNLPLKKWFGNYQGIIFFDECHLLGNPKSLRSQAILENLKYFEYRYLFSATPADKEIKMYSLLKILDPSLVKGARYEDWLSDYCEIGTRFSKFAPNVDTWDQAKWTRLNDKLYHEYAVKRGKEVLHLPAAYDVPVMQFKMSEAHREIYEAFSYEVLNEAKSRNNNAGTLANLTNTFSYLQLAVDNPCILKTTKNFDKFPQSLRDNVNKFNYEKSITKLDGLDAIIDDECNEKGNKIIIFYYHPVTLTALKNHLKTNYYELSAEVLKEERLPLIEKFKKAKEKILLASILIANTSFTLTEAKAAVYFETTWDYIIYFQSKGRIHRIGQEDETRYYNLAYEKSIDFLRLKALDTKGIVMNNLIQKNTLNTDEWKILFGGTQEQYSKFLD